MILESERLYYREFTAADDVLLFQLDSNPEVHRYLGNNPVAHIDQVREYLASVINQYATNGVGRMAAFLKETDEFIGWGGLKLESNVNGHDRFYDIGYRLLPQFWGRGYATESAKFFISYGFNQLDISVINATALRANTASCSALIKSGLQEIETFDYDGEEAVWFEIIRQY